MHTLFLFLLDTATAIEPPAWATMIATVAAAAIGLILHFVPAIPSRIVSIIGTLAFVASAIAGYLAFLPPGIAKGVVGVSFILVALNERLTGGKSLVDGGK